MVLSYWRWTPGGLTTLFLGSEDVTVTGAGSGASVSKVVAYHNFDGSQIAYRLNGCDALLDAGALGTSGPTEGVEFAFRKRKREGEVISMIVTYAHGSGFDIGGIGREIANWNGG